MDWGLQPVQANNHIITSYGRASCGHLLTVCNPSSTASSSNAWDSASRAKFIPFTVGTPFVAKTMIVSIANTGSSGNLDTGIYDTEGNRLTNAGSTAQAAASTAQQLNITDVLLEPGLYYMALVHSNTTGTYNATPIGNVGCVSATGILQMASAGPALPATATFAANTGSWVPYLAVSGRTLL